MTRHLKPWLGASLAVALALPAGAGAPAAAAGVYQYVIHGAEGSVESVAAAIAAAAPGAGFGVLAEVPSGVPVGCRFSARALALYQPEYAQHLLAANPRTGAFAVVDRINVFADEKGVHVSVLNPRSVARTVLMNDQQHTTLLDSHLGALRQLIAGAVKGSATEQDYGQRREKGYIGRTMGVMAGGPFADKIEDVAVVPGDDWRGTAERVGAALGRKGSKWGMQLAYTLEIPEAQLVVLGSTGSPMDSRSFEIVRAGADDSRGRLQCPGLAHAGAYPIEIVVSREPGTVRVRLVDAMYRMKMYFEDAGNWAFMQNMGMPGSIRSELSSQIRGGLPSR